MAVTVESFRTEFVEFRSTPTPLVQAKLAQALLRTPVNIWGAKQDAGVSYLAAHLIAMSPGGEEMRLDKKKGTTLYQLERRRLSRTVASGFRTAGE